MTLEPKAPLPDNTSLPSAALQSLLIDEGAGTPVAAAAGEVAAGGPGYSARTQAAMVVAYHLMTHDGVDPWLLAGDLIELGRAESSVYTRPSDAFISWLRSVESGDMVASVIPTSESATRVVPVGIWFRDDVDRLIDAAVQVARIENIDASSVVVAVTCAGTVAASTMAMSGWDLVLAATETAERTLEHLDRNEFTAFESAQRLPTAIASLRQLVGRPYNDIVAALSDVDAGLWPALGAIIVAADTRRDPALTVEDAGVNGGPDAGALAGAILGARLGLRRWPWRVPNETWFVEVGRRLVRRERELRDLPVPFAVEQRMQSATKVDPSTEIG